ncbi:MAG TPA: hypothetical protein VF068_02890 [Rubrobacter sp.]
MRRILLLALTSALLVAMAAGTATAKGPGSGKGKGPATVTYVFKGEMASVAGGNKAGRSAVASGDPLSIIVTPETRVELNDQEASMADLQAGDDVVVQAKGQKGDTSFTARTISAERAEQSAPADGSADNSDAPAS